MAVVAEAGDLAKAQLAIEEADVLVREFVGDALTAKDGGVGPATPPREAAEATFAVRVRI